MSSLFDVPVGELVEKVRSGETSAVALVTESLQRIAAGKELNAFVSVQGEAALERARRIDARRTAGEKLGALAGIPVAIKDNLVTRGAPTTAGSAILCKAATEAKPDPTTGFVSPYDATVVEKLLGADAIIVGKTNLDEFAMGSSNEHSAFGPVLNPHDTSRAPGGSSGGSAVAVAAKMVPLALGSDTGGSIRQPAALTGVVGFKPTYGRVSRYGLIAFASSLDQIGGFAGDAASAELLASVLQGHDPMDATSLSAEWSSSDAVPSLQGLRVGVPIDDGQACDPEVWAAFESAKKLFLDHGAVVETIPLPHSRYGISAYYVIAAAEASSNLARFDGVRYGKRERRDSVGAMYKATRSQGFGEEVKRRILLGTYVLSAGYYDAYYLRAQKTRTLIRRDFDQAFARVDVVMTPTTPSVAFPIGSKTKDPLAMYAADLFTLPASLAGLPALSLPLPGPEKRLPVGLQLVAPPLAEARLFSVARAAEAALRRHG